MYVAPSNVFFYLKQVIVPLCNLSFRLQSSRIVSVHAGAKKPYRISPSAFSSTLSIGFVRFPQVFSGFLLFLSDFGQIFVFESRKSGDFPGKTEVLFSSLKARR